MMEQFGKFYLIFLSENSQLLEQILHQLTNTVDTEVVHCIWTKTMRPRHNH